MVNLRLNVASRKNQRGVVLIVALVVLLVLSIIGISGMQGTVMQERMAGNAQDRNIAFQAAEAALRVGEDNARQGLKVVHDAESNPAPSAYDLAYDINVWLSTHNYDVGGGLAPPLFLIERQRALPPLEADQPVQAPLVRVSARATGRNDTTVVVLQSIYKP